MHYNHNINNIQTRNNNHINIKNELLEQSDIQSDPNLRNRPAVQSDNRARISAIRSSHPLCL